MPHGDTTTQPSYLYNEILHTWKGGFYIETGPTRFYTHYCRHELNQMIQTIQQNYQNLKPHLHGANSGLIQAHNSISIGWVPHTMNNQAAIWGWQQGNLSDQHALQPKEIESHGANRTTKPAEPNYSIFSLTFRFTILVNFIRLH